MISKGAAARCAAGVLGGLMLVGVGTAAFAAYPDPEGSSGVDVRVDIAEVQNGALSPDRAEDARQDFHDLAIVRYPHQPLADRMWQLRDNLTAYDAAFLALAEMLDVPLVTCDARLAHSSGHRAQVELFGAA